MKHLLLLITIICSYSVSCFSQNYYSPCKDSMKFEDPTYYCFLDFEPVCACDGITYRNWCVAENQFAISSGNYVFGPCTNFAYDISPNQVNSILQLKFKKKSAGYFTVTIYDYFGHIYYTRVYNYSDVTANYQKYEISVLGFEQGLYIIEVISDNEQQLNKFFKVSLD